MDRLIGTPRRPAANAETVSLPPGPDRREPCDRLAGVSFQINKLLAVRPRVHRVRVRVAGVNMIK